MAGRDSQAEPLDSGRDLGPAADPEAVARAIVLRKLTGQARSRRELEDALAAKRVPAEVSARVLDRFTEVGLINDAAFAEAWVQSRFSSRGLAGRALAQELRRKGINDALVRSTVDAIDAGQERNQARSLVDRKLNATRSLDREKRFRRLTAMLARKGYSTAVSMSVVREALAADEQLSECSAANP